MLKAPLLVVFVVALAGPASADTDVVTKQLTALSDAARCKDAASPFRPWCIVADFATGKAADLPKGKKLVGITIELAADADVKQALTDKVSPSVLVIDDAGMAKLSRIKGSNASENTMLGEAVASLATVFKHKAATAKLPADLTSYVKTLKAKYPTKKTAAEWTWTGESTARLRKVGDFWVAIEIPSDNKGIFASVFTDAWQ
jgi:hypothetical protein